MDLITLALAKSGTKQLKEQFGSPLVASAASEMTDQNRVYVYTGDETGYTNGNWYYYDGTSWTDGGVYNAVAVDTDSTLSVEGKAADAKVVGDEIADLKSKNKSFVDMLPEDTISGSMVAFPDGAEDLSVKDLNVVMNPVQDLHGYDHPWPAGGGKNLCSDISSDYTKTINYWVWHTTLEDGTYYITVTAKSGTETGYAFVIAKSGDAYSEFVGPVTVLTTAGATYNTSFIVDSTWINPVIGVYCPNDKTVSDFFANYTVQLEKNATATTYAPYSNICPITGRSGVEVTRTGKNLWDEEWEVGSINNSTGLPVPDETNIRGKNFISIVPNTDYFFYIGVNKNIRYYFYDINKTFISSDVANNITVKSPSNAYWLKVHSTGEYGATYNHDISINYPSTETEYHAYTGKNYSVAFPTEAGTVYGGTLDVTTGELVVDRAMAIKPPVGNVFSQTNPAVIVNANNVAAGVNNTANAKLISNACKTLSANIQCGQSVLAVALNSSSQIRLSVPGLTTKAEYEAWVDDNNFTVVYPLATPITYQLTPQEVKTLLGYNTIFSDGDSVEVTYRADVKRYIDKKIAEVQALILEKSGN